MKTARRGMALVWAIAVLACLGVWAWSSWFQVSNARKVLERVYARRLVDITANSAFEEALARFESHIQPFPVPAHGVTRNLQDGLGGEQTIEPTQLQADAKPEGITVGAVKVRSGKWVLDEPQHPPAGPVKISEIGIVELEVDIKVMLGSTALNRRVTARRYAWAAPPASGGTQCRVAVQSYNVVYQIKEI
jgi:hypothetical protein